MDSQVTDEAVNGAYLRSCSRQGSRPADLRYDSSLHLTENRLACCSAELSINTLFLEAAISRDASFLDSHSWRGNFGAPFLEAPLLKVLFLELVCLRQDVNRYTATHSSPKS